MWTITKNKSWDELSKLSWVADMHGVPQSPVHHAEGDVAVHTQMVISELEKLEEYQTLTGQDKEILWAAALMHDIEKRSTTMMDETGNIVSPGHAKKGALTTRQVLYREIETPFAIREQVAGLVRYHGLPLWVFEKQNPVQSLLKASIEVNTALLAMLAKADVLGRVCNDKEELLYKIDMFQELCIEQDCWGKPKQFPSPLARFRYFRKEDASPDYLPFDDTKSQVIIMSGIPGSGKDRYIKKHYPKLPVISLDDMRREQKIAHKDSKGNGRIIQEAKEQAKEHLRAGKPFVWNATNVTAQMRAQLIDLVEVYDPVIKIVYIEVPYQKMLTQNRNRPYPIPQTVVDKLIDKLEIPQVWEANEVEYVLR